MIDNMVNPDLCVVRVEVLTYDGAAVSKENVVLSDSDAMPEMTSGCVWKFHDILYGTEEYIKNLLRDYNYCVRVVVRPSYVKHKIYDTFRRAGRESRNLDSRSWFSGRAFDGAKQMPADLGVSVSHGFIQQWRNF